jgi:hypothetical protein
MSLLLPVVLVSLWARNKFTRSIYAGGFVLEPEASVNCLSQERMNGGQGTTTNPTAISRQPFAVQSRASDINYYDNTRTFTSVRDGTLQTIAVSEIIGGVAPVAAGSGAASGWCENHSSWPTDRVGTARGVHMTNRRSAEAACHPLANDKTTGARWLFRPFSHRLVDLCTLGLTQIGPMLRPHEQFETGPSHDDLFTVVEHATGPPITNHGFENGPSPALEMQPFCRNLRRCKGL